MNKKIYNSEYYKLHRGEINKKRNKGIQNKRELNIGERFNRLTVLNFFGKDDHGKFCYLCKCDCGKEKVVRKTYLLRGRVKSCGCLHSETCSLTGKKTVHLLAKINFNGIEDLSGEILCKIKNNAYVRNIEYNVSKEYLWNLYLLQNKKCALSGVDIKFGNKYKKLTTTASLDRIESSSGYVEGNVQWVHKHINMMKRQLNNREFLDWCKTTTNYNENKPTPEFK